MKSKIILFLSTLGVAFLSFGATAAAANVVTPDDGSLLELAGPLFDAITRGQWWLAASAAVVVICVAAKRYLPDSWGGARIRSRVGLVALAFVVSLAGAVFNTLIAPGAVMSAAVAIAALKIAVTSTLALLAGSAAVSTIAARKATA